MKPMSISREMQQKCERCEEMSRVRVSLSSVSVSGTVYWD